LARGRAVVAVRYPALYRVREIVLA
jgi:hypothetical protein